MKKVRNLVFGVLAMGALLVPSAAFADEGVGMETEFVQANSGLYATIYTPSYTYTANGYRDDVTLTDFGGAAADWEGEIGYTFANNATNPRYSFSYYDSASMSNPYEVFSVYGPATNSSHAYQVAYEPSNGGMVGRVDGTEIGSSPYSYSNNFQFFDNVSNPSYARHDGSISAAVKWSNPEYLTTDLSKWVPTGSNVMFGSTGSTGAYNNNAYSSSKYFYTWDTRN